MYLCSLLDECKNAGNIRSLCALARFKNALCFANRQIGGTNVFYIRHFTIDLTTTLF